jgi:FixJ family two-component response regulator
MGNAGYERYRLEELSCTLPTIFVTGHGDVPTAVETMKNGAFDLIKKSYIKQVLIDAIQKALSQNISTRSHNNKVKSFSDTQELQSHFLGCE